MNKTVVSFFLDKVLRD